MFTGDAGNSWLCGSHIGVSVVDADELLGDGDGDRWASISLQSNILLLARFALCALEVRPMMKVLVWFIKAFTVQEVPFC